MTQNIVPAADVASTGSWARSSGGDNWALLDETDGRGGTFADAHDETTSYIIDNSCETGDTVDVDLETGGDKKAEDEGETE